MKSAVSTLAAARTDESRFTILIVHAGRFGTSSSYRISHSELGYQLSVVSCQSEILTENRKLITDYLAKSGMRFGELPATQPLRLRALSVFRAIFVAVCFSDRLLSIDETHCSNVFLTCFSFFCVLRSVVVDELRRTFRLVGMRFSVFGYQLSDRDSDRKLRTDN
jgi:hypothetical protein